MDSSTTRVSPPPRLRDLVRPAWTPRAGATEMLELADDPALVRQTLRAQLSRPAGRLWHDRRPGTAPVRRHVRATTRPTVDVLHERPTGSEGTTHCQSSGPTGLGSRRPRVHCSTARAGVDSAVAATIQRAPSSRSPGDRLCLFLHRRGSPAACRSTRSRVNAILLGTVATESPDPRRLSIGLTISFSSTRIFPQPGPAGRPR